MRFLVRCALSVCPCVVLFVLEVVVGCVEGHREGVRVHGVSRCNGELVFTCEVVLIPGR